MDRAKLTLAVVSVGTALMVAPTAAVATHAPAKPIHPGVMTESPSGQCTANFVFRDGNATYLGQAAHCTGTGAATATNGCEARSLPLGTKVEIDGASAPGELAYNSWLTMQAVDESDPDACAFNDFALVRIAAADLSRVDPSVPAFGGPTGLGPSSSSVGDTVYSYGNSSLRAGVAALSPKQGVVLSTDGDGWSRSVLAVTPGLPGDSGSGVLSASGKAIGVVSTLELLPRAASNGVGDLGRELDYMRRESNLAAALVPGTKPFRPNLIEAILDAAG